MYNGMVSQYERYIGHVAKNIAGIFETPKKVEQEGAVYEFVPKSTQKEAMNFLNKQLFTTPLWLNNENINNRIGNNSVAIIGARQETILNRLTSNSSFAKLIRTEAALGSKAYTITDMMADLQQGIWSELNNHKAIDVYRRNLQKVYIERLGGIINPQPSTGITIFLLNSGATIDNKKSDVISVLKGNLRTLKNEITGSLPFIHDKPTENHLQDVLERINRILNPK